MTSSCNACWRRRNANSNLDATTTDCAAVSVQHNHAHWPRVNGKLPDDLPLEIDVTSHPQCWRGNSTDILRSELCLVGRDGLFDKIMWSFGLLSSLIFLPNHGSFRDSIGMHKCGYLWQATFHQPHSFLARILVEKKINNQKIFHSICNIFLLQSVENIPCDVRNFPFEDRT